MTLQQKLTQADDYLDMLKDKAKETDKLAKENLQLRIKISKAIEYMEYYFAKGRTKNARQFDLSLYEILTGTDLFNFTRKEKDQFFKERIKSEQV